MNWPECIILFLVALVATIALVPSTKILSKKLGAIDYPDQRRVNKEPTPRLGGLAIFGGLCTGLILLEIGINFWGWQDPFIPHPNLDVNYAIVGIGIFLMFIVGFIDDIFDLPPKVKLLGQLVAASVIAGSGLLLSVIHNPLGEGFISFGIWAFPITVFYITAFSNVINLIDGLDGLASGICAITGITMFAFSVLTSRPDAMVLCAVLVGACIGFLRYNFSPASIFMGDCGALTLGTILACISLLSIGRSTLIVSLLVPVIAAGVPILDTLSAIVRRTRANQPIDIADKGHIHHRLLEAGLSQRATVLVMWGCTAFLSICALLIGRTTGLVRTAVFIVILLAIAIVTIQLRLFGPVLKHHYTNRVFRPRSKKGESSQSKTAATTEENSSHNNDSDNEGKN